MVHDRMRRRAIGPIRVLRNVTLRVGPHIKSAVAAALRDSRLVATGLSAADGYLDRRPAKAGQVLVDSESMTRTASGEFIAALAAAAIEPDRIVAEIGSVLAGHHAGRTSADEITMFKSLGCPPRISTWLDTSASRRLGEVVAWD